MTAVLVTLAIVGLAFRFLPASVDSARRSAGHVVAQLSAGLEAAPIRAGTALSATPRGASIGDPATRALDPPAPRQTYPHIVPGDGEPLVVQSHSFGFNGSQVTVTPAVDPRVYRGAASAVRVMTELPGESRADWERTFNRFLVLDRAQSPAIDSVCRQLRAYATDKGLDRDQYLELLAKYVQSMPYATERLGDARAGQAFPIETIVDARGVCGDKALLLAALLSHEGYACALLTFDAERHAAVGVKGPGPTYPGTDYLFLETTSPTYVSEIPSVYVGGITLKSTPVVTPIGAGTGTYGAAADVARIVRARDRAAESAKQLLRNAEAQQLSASEARSVNAKLDQAFQAQLQLQSNVTDLSTGKVGEILDRTQAISWLNKNAWWE